MAVTSHVCAALVAAGNVPPVRLTDVGVPATVPPVQVVAAPLAVMAPGEVGSKSLTAIAVNAGLPNGLVMTNFITLVPPAAMFAGVNDLTMVGGATTVKLAVPVLPVRLMPAPVPVTAPVVLA